ncbi:MAG: hypothetical protein AAF329_27130 [Cyanobacteria bacterium P01_A01_bin.17]
MVPSIAAAQDWKDWANNNPTYPSQSRPPVTPPPAAPNPSPVSNSSDSFGISSTQSPAFEQLFMKGCTSKGGPQASSFCACTLTELQNTHTIQELNQLGFQMQQTGELPESFQDIVVSCISRLQ